MNWLGLHGGVLARLLAITVGPGILRRPTAAAAASTSTAVSTGRRSW